MRSVGCGLLLLAISTASAIGQAIPGIRQVMPGLPSLEEARTASPCDTTRWAKTIAEIKAAEPERDADQQIAGGNISLKRIEGPRSGVGTPRESQSFILGIETYISSSDGTRIDRRLVDLRTARYQVPPGVVCHPNLPVAGAFPIVDYVEDETTDALSKRCVRVVLVLAKDYLRRFNQRVVGHPAFPHKDLCWADGDTNVRRGIAYRPSADLIPTNIPDVATAARFGLADRLAQFIAEAVPYAVERKSLDLVRLLARHGADLNRGRPPLPSAVRTHTTPDPLGRVPPPIPRADVRKTDPPIFLALDPLMDVNMVELLLNLGADPNVRDSSGRTPLMVAIVHSRIYGRRDGVAWIEWYVPQRLIDGQEDWAHRGVEPVRALLAKGADLALRDRDGLTALHHAARSDYNVEIAGILWAHGADINARDVSGRTPLDHARAARLTRMPEFLVAAGGRSGGP